MSQRLAATFVLALTLLLLSCTGTPKYIVDPQTATELATPGTPEAQVRALITNTYWDSKHTQTVYLDSLQVQEGAAAFRVSPGNAETRYFFYAFFAPVPTFSRPTLVFFDGSGGTPVVVAVERRPYLEVYDIMRQAGLKPP